MGNAATTEFSLSSYPHGKRERSALTVLTTSCATATQQQIIHMQTQYPCQKLGIRIKEYEDTFIQSRRCPTNVTKEIGNFQEVLAIRRHSDASQQVRFLSRILSHLHPRQFPAAGAQTRSFQLFTKSPPAHFAPASPTDNTLANPSPNLGLLAPHRTWAPAAFRIRIPWSAHVPCPSPTNTERYLLHHL